MANQNRNQQFQLPGEKERNAKKTYDIQNKVYVMEIKKNNTKFKFKPLSPFPFKKKIGNIIYNENGKFFCFVIENHNHELPQLMVYDVRKIFP